MIYSTKNADENMSCYVYLLAMSRFIIDFTPPEKRRFWRAGLSLRNLENYTLHEIIEAVRPDKVREEDIRNQFYNQGNNTLIANGLMEIGRISLNYDSLKGSILGNKTAKDFISRTEKLFPHRLLSALSSIENTTAFLRPSRTDPFANLFGPSYYNSLFSSAVSGKSMLDNFKPIYERLNSLKSSFSPLDRLQKNNQSVLTSVLSSNSSSLERVSASKFSFLSSSILREDSFKKFEIGSLANSLATVSLFEKTHTTSVSEALFAAGSYTKLAQANLGAFQWDSIGKRSSLSNASIKAAQHKFMDVSSGYSNLLRTISSKPNWIYESPETAKIPAQDYYVASRILKIISVDDDPEIDNFEKLETEIREENKDAIGKYLPLVHINLPDLWSGALQAMKSQNPDKIRHMIISLRELYTHVLHILAPDDAVYKWDEKQEHYNDGKPTRKGRFLYICRNLNGSNSQFAKLLKTEIDATLAMVNLFQGGTHSIKPIFSLEELEFIKIKADTTLRTFLMIEFEINRR